MEDKTDNIICSDSLENNVINSSNGIIMDKHFDQNITLLAKLTENTFQEITKHFPTIIIKRVD